MGPMRMKRAWAAAVVFGALAGLAVSAPGPAFAQEAPKVSKKVKEKALKQYRKAKKKFDARKFDEALAGFQESYATFASPNSHLMVARTLAELGRHFDAIAEYEKVQAESLEAAKEQPKYQKTAESARTELEEVKKKLAVVTVKVTGAGAGATVKLGDESLPSEQWGQQLLRLPGALVAVLTTADGKESRKELTLVAGGSATIELSPPAPEVLPSTPTETAPTETASFDSSTATPRTWAYVTGGVGLAGLAGFGVLGFLSNNKFDDLEKACPTRIACDPSLQSDADQGKRFQTAANVSLVVGAAGLGAGLALLFTTGSSSKEVASKKKTVVGIGPGSVMVSGKF